MLPAAPHLRLIVGIVITTLLIGALVIADLAVGGRPDPHELRAASTLLDGEWRFRTGDDPQWAAPHFVDSTWETIDLTAAPGSHDGDVGLPDYVGGWMAHGHPDYRGYAWYRREVTVPASATSWDILGPTQVDSGYELYWNGQLLGGSGRLGAQPRLVGTRPLRFPLPADAAGARGVLAIRAYLPPGGSASADSGGLHSAPILAPQPIGAALHHVQWQRTIAGYVVDAVEPACMALLVGLALWCRARGSTRRSFLVCAAIALALMAERRLNNAIVSWTDLQSIPTYAWLASVMWVPTVAAWLLAWNRWLSRSWLAVDLGAVALAIIGTLGALNHWSGVTSAFRYASLALFALLGVRILRDGPMRVLAPLTLITILAGYFGAELLDPLGVPGIWFPFGIGVSRTQYIYSLLIPLLAGLFVRTLPSSRDSVSAT